MRKLRLVQDLEYDGRWSLQERVWGIWFERQYLYAPTIEVAQWLLDDATKRVTLYPSKA